MKLQLTVFAKDLILEDGGDECNPFVVVAQAHPEPGSKPTVLGKSEALRNTLDPDFTKLFLLYDFELGKPMHVIVTIHDAKNQNKSLGSAMFEVGAILGTKGGVLGKQVKSGGYIMVHVERTSGLGTLCLKLRGLDLVSKQDQIDPYFELQKKRKTTSGDTVWDVVYRSVPVKDTANPIWSEISVDFGLLCSGKKKTKFRISVKDYDDSDDSLIGSCFVTAEQLLDAVTEGADASNLDDIDTTKAISLKRPKPLREMGKILVASAMIEDLDREAEIAVEPEQDIAVINEEDIVVEVTEDIEIMLDDMEGVNFADYISGGCQLRVIVAIDYTASNGDPRKESSLHHFKKDGLNAYETSISKICSILSDYDYDKKYPVWGFGAKKDGQVSHRFLVGDQEEVDDVDGILEAYKHAFKSGIAMSKPTDITEVIKAASQDAQKSLESATKEGRQAYTILAVFTNGNVHSEEETIAAVQEAKDHPLSIVVVGVGSSSFCDMNFLNEYQENGESIHFVDTKSYQDGSLAEATLHEIPQQMVAYFGSKGIKPNPPVETDEIVIEPFNEEEEVEANVVVSENGEVTLETDAKPPEDAQTPSKIEEAGIKGKSILLGQAKRQFGRIGKQMERKINRLIDQKVNKMFGISNPMKKPARRRN